MITSKTFCVNLGTRLMARFRIRPITGAIAGVRAHGYDIVLKLDAMTAYESVTVRTKTNHG
jgi:hypothetical protein